MLPVNGAIVGSPGRGRYGEVESLGRGHGGDPRRWHVRRVGLPERLPQQLGQPAAVRIGVVHICEVPDLDPTVPGRLAGAWKRRSDHLARLAGQ